MQSIISGFLVSISLIAAIGAQNAMVLRHGIARSHVAAVAVFCIVSDALLMRWARPDSALHCRPTPGSSRR